MLFYTEYIHYLNVKVGDDFLLYFACGMSVLRVSGNNQPAYWDSTCLGTTFSWWKCPVEIAVCVHHVLPKIFWE